MLKKLKGKVSKELRDNLSFVSDSTVKFIIKKDLMSRGVKYQLDIDRHFRYFVTNYLQVLKYLKRDFKQKYINEKDGKVNINDEINLISKVYDKLAKKKYSKISRVTKYSPTRLNNTMEKWKVLNDAFEEYPKLLKHFDTFLTAGIHKNINIEQEYGLLENCDYLKENFDILIKKVAEDKKKNG